jgi:N-acetylneuraminic acid mutarotase
MRLVAVGIVAVIVFGGGRAWADFVWAQKADMPTPRWTQTSAVVNGKIYVIGGEPSEPSGGVGLSSVEEYDPATDTWTIKADMPTGRRDFVGSSAVVDGKIYVIGGWDGSTISTVEEYDPATDTWRRKGDMPTRRCSLATVAVDGKIYAIGGLLSWDNLSGLRTVEEYNPATDTWTRKADMPRGVWGLCASVFSGKIYAMGGRPNLRAKPYVQEYDPATDTWTKKADMPVATSQMGSAVLGNKIVIIGGWLWSANQPYTTMQIYDTETDIWKIEADVPFKRAVFSADVVNNMIYAIGGTDRPHPCPALSTVFELTINPPPPDFNGDGIVDAGDMCIMVDHWGEDYSLCDIAPPPFGDGIVDVEDLVVLSEHLFEEVDDPTLMAHWPLDETEGMFATDSAGDNDAVVLGGIEWQPAGGQIDGALQLDGVSGYAVAGEVLNPADGPFSVFAWINGGAPGQVVLSQSNGANWLATDTEGKLMTELKCTGRSAGYLFSEVVITDGQWHRIGLVWDGSHRRLYVDGVVVAEDTQDGLQSSNNGLYLGCGKGMESDTFFSGLIDDIRIYNRAVSP